MPVERVDAETLSRIARGGAHQDIVAEVAAARDYSVEDLVASAGSAPPLLVVLDGIEDPHNVGAILRTADAAGVHGVVRQARHAASLDGVVGEGIGGGARARADCHGREHCARGRGVEGARASGPSASRETRRNGTTPPT